LAKITLEMIEAVYTSALSVIASELTEDEAVSDIEADCGMNPSSAKMYLRCAIGLIRGKDYGRTVNAQAMDYFFTRIKKDSGKQGLERALAAFDRHAELNSNPQLNLKNIAARHRRLLD
jgi:hypothetical protein